jgi:hypothetical protein
MSPIYFNKGTLLVFLSALITAFLLSWIYEGNHGTLLIVQVMSYSCVFLEFTRDFKPRVNGVFPLFYILVPIGCYLTAQQKGIGSLVVYLLTVSFVFFIGRNRGKQSLKQSVGQTAGSTVDRD